MLPLHIFEPRYRQMVGECLERASTFGVVLIRAGLEVGAPAEPFDVGTVAEILQDERFPDGRMNILCVGRGRFRIREITSREPYLVGAVEGLVDGLLEPDVGQLAARLKRCLSVYITSATGVELPTMPESPTALSFAAPALLPLELGEQQALLEMSSVRERLARLIASVEREIGLGRSMGVTRASHPGGIGRLSSN